MYAYIKGKISEINPTNIVVDNNGIGYEIVVANPYEYQLNEEKTVFISQQVREDSNILYGYQDVTYLTKFPGIGKKSAQQIILDLQGKVDFSMNNISSAPTAVNNYLSDAMLALEALGYSKKELAKIEKKLSAFDFSGVDEYVKQGLKLLMNA